MNKPDNTFTYKTVQRACCADALIPLQLQDIFDFSEENQFGFDIPEEDYSKVKEKVYSYGAYANYGKSKSKGYPYTGGQSTPSNVSKVQTRYYDEEPYEYDYYGGFRGYLNGGYSNSWDSSGIEDDVPTLGLSQGERNWANGTEALLDKSKFNYIFTILSGMSKPGDDLLYSNPEFKEIESAAHDFVSALSLPETHPYYMFSELLKAFMCNLVENISEVHSGDREGFSEVEDPSKAFVVAISSAIHSLEESFYNEAIIGKEISDLMKEYDLKYLYLPERIAAYLENF